MLHTEDQIEAWQRTAKRFPGVDIELDESQKLAAQLERELGLSSERSWSDKQLLVGFKEQERMHKSVSRWQRLLKSARAAAYFFRSP